MSSCRLRCFRVPIAMSGFYKQSLWILEYFLTTNLDFHHRLLVLLCHKILCRQQGHLGRLRAK